jgi:hypothetical protein
VTSTEALADDPDLLKAMLLAEWAESERLRQIIKELQRHRFGRRAESLPEEQLQLGLEEAEQVEAATDAATVSASCALHAVGRTAAPCRPTCRGSRRSSISTARSARVAAARRTERRGYRRAA